MGWGRVLWVGQGGVVWCREGRDGVLSGVRAYHTQKLHKLVPRGQAQSMMQI